MHLTIVVMPLAGRRMLVRLTGEIDLHTAPDFRTALRQALASDPVAVLLDFSHVSYLSSAGIYALIEAGDALARRAAELVVVGAQAEALKVLEMVGLPQTTCRTAPAECLNQAVSQ